MPSGEAAVSKLLMHVASIRNERLFNGHWGFSVPRLAPNNLSWHRLK